MGKIVLVTGGGSGIGRTSALALLENGFTVVIAGRTMATLEETITHAKDRGLGNEISAIKVDVTNEQEVITLYSKIIKMHGRVDVLFNNAGINIGAASIDEISYQDWKRVINVNLSGAFLVAKEAFKTMKKQSPQGGRIINNGSISAQVPRPGAAPYNAAKNGITGLTKSIALEGRPYSIACGQIDIGNALSDMSVKMKKGVPQADGSIKTEPLFDIKHVGEAVVHMAQLPLNANILSMTIMASNMPFVGRG